MRRRWHTLSDGEKKYCYDLWCRGYTLGEIAEAMYVSRPTAYAAMGGKPKTKAKIAPYSEVRAQYEEVIDEDGNTAENGK